MLLKKNPDSLLRLALVFLATFGLLRIVVHPQTVFWTDVLDGVRGALVGASVALIALRQFSLRKRSAARS